MFPEVAREAAYKGANVAIRTAGYTVPIRNAWRITNQANAFCNLMWTVWVCVAGDGTGRSMGERMICDFEGSILAAEGGEAPNKVVTGEVVPRRADEARENWGWRTTPTGSATAATSP